MKKVDADRDSSLERLMKDALQSRMPAVSDTSDTSHCLSTETLAAWSEQALSSREREAVEAHAADCARCQAMLAAMVRITPVPVKTPWWRVHMMAWMVPVTAAAAALVVWMAIPGERGVAPREAMARAEPAPLSAPATTPAPSAALSSALSEPANERAKKEAAARPVPNAVGDAAKDSKLDRSRQQERAREESRVDEKMTISALAKAQPAPTPPADRIAESRAEALKDKQVFPQPPSRPVETPAPAAAPAPPAVAAAAPSPPPAPAPGLTAIVPAAPPADRRAFEAGRASGAVAQRAERDILASRVANAAPIVSPNPQNRWRIVGGGAVEHSIDGGATWQSQQTGVALTLTAGASPAPAVCWIVGPRGRIVVSTDGATWKPVPLAEPIDLVAVRATNDKTATVTAADGRTFTTVDGGATWQSR